MRGSAMSAAPICIGIIQFARPTVAGMTAPKTMTSACMVVIWLKNAGSTSCRPGWNSSLRMTNANAPPMRNISSENTRYIVPMSLWFVVVSQRTMPFGGPCAWSSWLACAISVTPWQRAPQAPLASDAQSQASNSAFGFAITTIGMKPWSAPQSSAHWPR